MKGKGEVQTYWLLGHKEPDGKNRRDDSCSISALVPQHSGWQSVSRRDSIVTFKNLIPSSHSHANLTSLHLLRLQQSELNHMSNISLSGRSSPRTAKKKMLRAKAAAALNARDGSMDVCVTGNRDTVLHNNNHKRPHQPCLSFRTAGGQANGFMSEAGPAVSDGRWIPGLGVGSDGHMVPNEKDEDLMQRLSGKTPPTSDPLPLRQSSPLNRAASPPLPVVRGTPVLRKHEMGFKKWISLNEIPSDGESRLSHSSSVGLLMPESETVIGPEKGHPIANHSLTPSIRYSCDESGRMPLSFTKWISGLVLRKISSDSNLYGSPELNQHLLPVTPQTVKDPVIVETNV